jgi:hypothetical protein
VQFRADRPFYADPLNANSGRRGDRRVERRDRAALIGSCVLLVLTLIGVFVAPAMVVLAAVLGVLGYLIATYLVGRALWGRFGALPPDTFLERALTALIGAMAVALIALVPFLDWLVILILTLTGLGALAVGVFRPELRTKY